MVYVGCREQNWVDRARAPLRHVRRCELPASTLRNLWWWHLVVRSLLTVKWKTVCACFGLLHGGTAAISGTTVLLPWFTRLYVSMSLYVSVSIADDRLVGWHAASGRKWTPAKRCALFEGQSEAKISKDKPISKKSVWSQVLCGSLRHLTLHLESFVLARTWATSPSRWLRRALKSSGRNL